MFKVAILFGLMCIFSLQVEGTDPYPTATDLGLQTYGWTSQTHRQWIDHFNIVAVRGAMHPQALKNSLQARSERYRGQLELIPTISNVRKSRHSVKLMLTKIKALQNVMNSTPMPGVTIKSISIDDFLGWYYHPIGWDYSHRRFSLKLATANMQRLIDAAAPTGVGLSATIYANELNLHVQGDGAFQIARRSDPKLCRKKTGNRPHCAHHPSCCLTYSQVFLHQSIREQIKLIYLYFHRRQNSADLAKFLAKTQLSFPNAKVVVGLYLWGHFGARREAKDFSDPPTFEQDENLFSTSLKTACGLYRRGKIAGIELYLGNFGNEHSWPGLTATEAASARASRDLAREILSSPDCLGNK